MQQQGRHCCTSPLQAEAARDAIHVPSTKVHPMLCLHVRAGGGHMLYNLLVLLCCTHETLPPVLALAESCVLSNLVLLVIDADLAQIASW